MRKIRRIASAVVSLVPALVLALVLVPALVLAAGALGVAPAAAKTFRFAAQGEYRSLDPHALNETFTLGLHAAVYEGLTKRGPKLEILPGLAERWEVVEPLRWRFFLRRGVKFHNGDDFTADDVLFSADRVRATGSNLTARIPADARFEKVDDFTVDVVLTRPNPILNAEWDTWAIMSRKWAEANGAGAPTPFSATTPGFATLNENGTGPFRIESHQPGVKTIWKPFADWWGKPEHNLTEAIFTPIGPDATRVAALLSGEVDWIEPVPVQEIARVNASPNAQVLNGQDLRTLFLGFDQRRDELKYSNIKGRNPFKDPRVRQAIYEAIDVGSLREKVMRGFSTPAALPISPLLYPRAAEFKRFPFDVDAARKLLSDAGYPQGFEVALDCPTDRYVADEAICQAVVGMLAKANIKVTLTAQPKGKFFAKVLAPAYDTSFYLMGWTPGSFDAWNVLYNLYGCRTDDGKGRGEPNLGGYCNPEVDKLTDAVLGETDPKARDDLIFQAFDIAQNKDVATVPLHQQPLSWGVSRKLKLVQRADDQFLFSSVVKE